MTEEFRLNVCRFCHNGHMDLGPGVQSGLEVEPEIVDDECSEFDPKTEEYYRTLKQDIDAEQYEEEKASNKYWFVAGIVITIIGIVIAFYNRSELDNDYRWTITSHSYPKNEFSFKSPLLSKTYLISTFSVNGIEFENKTELLYADRPDSTAFTGAKYFIRYNPENPNNSQIPELKLIPSYINHNQAPSNGIQKDSLKFFVQAQRKKYLENR